MNQSVKDFFNLLAILIVIVFLLVFVVSVGLIFWGFSVKYFIFPLCHLLRIC